MFKINQTIITRRTKATNNKILKSLKFQKTFFSNKNNSKFINNFVSAKNFFYKTEKKNFFGIFKNKINSYDDFISTKNQAKKEEKWFETSETLVFQDGKYPLLKAADKEVRMVKIFEWAILVPVLGILGYKFGKSLILLRPIRSILWGVLLFGVGRVYQGARINKHYFIYNLKLLEDGKRLEVHKEGGPFITDIANIRRLTQEEAIYFAQTMPDAHISYIPIIIEDQFYLIFKNSTVHDKEIFAEISNGKYIKVKAENKINKEDAIDIDSK